MLDVAQLKRLSLADYVKVVRIFTRDFPKLNELKGIFESPDDLLGLYCTMALDDYNTTPPLIQNVQFENFPSPSLLILGAVCFHFLSQGILQQRNSITYADGNQNVNVWDKGPAYMGNALTFANMWEQKKRAIKRSLNLQNGWGVVQSSDFNLYSYMAMYGGDYIISSVGAELGTSPVPLSYAGNLSINGDLIDVVPANGKNKTGVVPFSIDNFAPDADPLYYSLAFYHNLLCREVIVVLENPATMEDLSTKIKVFRVAENHLFLKVLRDPDGRMNGTIQCFRPN